MITLGKSFKGGVHPPSNKKRTKDKSLEYLPVPKKVIIPLLQHTGAICDPVVKEMDEVKAGQLIGTSKFFISANVHASISGKVTAIKLMPHPVLPVMVNSVIIEGEGYDQTLSFNKNEDWQKMDVNTIKEKIKNAGIVGLGGAAFPTHVKLSPPPEKKVNTLIINGAECEPFLTVDHRLMLEKTKELIEGIKIVLKVLNINDAIIGIEANKPDAVKVLKEQLGSNSNIKVAVCRVKYPQGAEKQLIKALIKKEIPSGGLPFDVGVIVQNIGTILAIYEAVVMDKPLIERAVTVSGDGIKEAKNLIVRIGTPFQEVVDYCGRINTDKESKVIMGGPLMGLAQYTLEVPVIKGTSGILILADKANVKKSENCIRCGRCISVCPIKLMPNKIADYAQIDNFEQTEFYGVLDCIECGACTYICGGGRPIVHYVKYAKYNLKKKK